MARSRAVSSFVGKRSGVTLDQQATATSDANDGSLKEGDLNAYFADAVAASQQQQQNKKAAPSKSKTKKLQQPSRDIRFSLDGEQSSAFSDSSKKAKGPGMLSKLRKGEITDADLSPVSAASPLAVKDDGLKENSIKSPPSIPEDSETVAEAKKIDDDKEKEEDQQYERLQAQTHQETENALPVGQNEEKSDENAPPLPPDDYVDGEYEEPDNYPMLPNDDDGDDHDDDTMNSRTDEANGDLIPPAPPDSPAGDNDEDEDVDEKEELKQVMSPEAKEVKMRKGTPKKDEDDSLARSDDKKKENVAKKSKKSKHKATKEESIKNKKVKASLEKKEKKTKRKSEERGAKGGDSWDKHRSVVVRVHTPKKKKTNNRFATQFSPKGIPLPREFDHIPISDFKRKSEEESADGLRRSKRTKIAPLEFWKNERPQYGPADDDEMEANGVVNMTVIKGYVKARETPYKARKAPHPRPLVKKTKAKNAEVLEESQPKPLEFDSSKLRKKYQYNDGEEAVLWDEGYEETKDLKVVSYMETTEARKLPLSKRRTKSEGSVVGKAAQAFNVPSGPKAQYVGYISGNLTLPPKGIKDAESVGSCAQVFTVVSCQPKALEVAYADPEDDTDDATFNPDTAERFLLKAGDIFRVPPGNAYRLCNHSKETDVLLTWTIIRPAVLPPSTSQKSLPLDSEEED